MPTGLKIYDLMRELTDAEREAMIESSFDNLDDPLYQRILEGLVESRSLRWVGENGMWDLISRIAIIYALDIRRQKQRPVVSARTNGHRQGYGGQWR